MWARGTEEALNSEGDRVAAMGLWLAENVRQLSQLTALVRGKLTKLERGVIVALVTTDVHARDIVEQLYEAKVDKVGEPLCARLKALCQPLRLPSCCHCFHIIRRPPPPPPVTRPPSTLLSCPLGSGGQFHVAAAAAVLL
jgi:hypothetical protein